MVELLGAGASASQIATATIIAAEKGLNLAANDPALVETVHLLTQLPIAARSEDFVGRLREAGIDVPDALGLMDVVAGFSEAVERRTQQGRRTDLGEMAQMAATETIAGVIGERTRGLFGTDTTQVREAFGGLGTVAQFSGLAKQFFGRLTDRVLNYYLSRAFNSHLGEGKRFSTLAQHAYFTEALDLHCRQASVIVERFSGEWFSKTNWQQSGITRDAARGFTHVAMQKLVSELKAGARSPRGRLADA